MAGTLRRLAEAGVADALHDARQRLVRLADAGTRGDGTAACRGSARRRAHPRRALSSEPDARLHDPVRDAAAAPGGGHRPRRRAACAAGAVAAGLHGGPHRDVPAGRDRRVRARHAQLPHHAVATSGRQPTSPSTTRCRTGCAIRCEAGSCQARLSTPPVSTRSSERRCRRTAARTAFWPTRNTCRRTCGRWTTCRARSARCPAGSCTPKAGAGTCTAACVRQTPTRWPRRWATAISYVNDAAYRTGPVAQGFSLQSSEAPAGLPATGCRLKACATASHDLARPETLLGRQHDPQAVHRVVHVRGQVEVLLNRPQQVRLLPIARAPGDRARPRC